MDEPKLPPNANWFRDPAFRATFNAHPGPFDFLKRGTWSKLGASATTRDLTDDDAVAMLRSGRDELHASNLEGLYFCARVQVEHGGRGLSVVDALERTLLRDLDIYQDGDGDADAARARIEAHGEAHGGRGSPEGTS